MRLVSGFCPTIEFDVIRNEAEKLIMRAAGYDREELAKLYLAIELRSVAKET